MSPERNKSVSRRSPGSAGVSPASSSRSRELAGETPALPGTLMRPRRSTRREFIRSVSLAGAATGLGSLSALAETSPAPQRDKALIAITLDLEMARNFPRWEDTHWDY